MPAESVIFFPKEECDLDEDEDSCYRPCEVFAAMLPDIDDIATKNENDDNVNCPVSELDDTPVIGENKSGNGGDSHEDR